MSPGDILAGVALASVPLRSVKLAVVLALVAVSAALVYGMWLVFDRRGGS